MFENSLFSISNKIPNLEKFKRIQKIYTLTEEEKTLYKILITEDFKKNKKTVKITLKTALDKNKQRIGISTEILKSKISENYEVFLTLLNFQLISKKEYEMISIKRENYKINYYINKENEYHVIKVYTITKNSHEGDEILLKATKELNSYIKLVKAPYNSLEL